MEILLALMSALSYGAADFAGGLASRRFTAGAVTAVAQLIGMLTALVAVALFAAAGPNASELEWGALSGIGSALGTLSLYHGLSVGRMTIVASVSGVLTAAIPVIAGVALGNHLSSIAAAGIVIAIPAIALVSWQSQGQRAGARPSGLRFGVLAGVGFGLLLVALERAGTHAGAWPLIPGQIVSVLLIIPFALRGVRGAGRPTRDAVAFTIGAGVLSGLSNVLYLAATGHGPLAIVAVVTALYPAATVVLARVFLAERLTSTQLAGLVVAALSVVLVTVR